ncbi:MAG: LPS export ABC transporter periplasmic protein LptC [Candidatus Omnitrophica bacterium]|nr:LPS export ABC transporter periplasmic protein LptC [Candidatus Omnitrophota bacterium]
MIKRFVTITAVVGLAYVSFVMFKLYVGMGQTGATPAAEEPADETHKVYSFSFSKYATNGKKELEIEGDSADILMKSVALSNVIAKAYAEETPVTITADQGVFDKSTSTVHLKRNVVATTQEGARLLTESLNIHPAEKSLDTADKVSVKKDNIDVDGLGARGDSDLKTVKFKKNVTVVIQSDDPDSPIPTVITCDGPLDINYDQNIAHFEKNVVATDHRGKLTADRMNVYYDKDTRKVAKIEAFGNVIITTPEGNATYAEEVTYFAQEGRILMGGGTEAVYFPGAGSKIEDTSLFRGEE